MTFTSRPYTGEADLQAISDLLTLCEASDHLGLATSVAHLRSDFASPTVDPARDLRLWDDAAGNLIAFANVDNRAADHGVDSLLWFRLQPDARSAALATDVMAWASARTTELEQEHVGKVVLQSGAHVDDAWRRKLLERNGFSVIRYFWRMDHLLDTPIPAPCFLAGFELRETGETHEEAVAWVELFNQSFIDHWNHHPLTVERLLHLNATDPTYRREYDLVAVAPDGTLAAFCVGGIDAEENARTGRNESSIDVLGTRRGYRKLGLGRAMLLAALQRFQTNGITSTHLIVDAASPSGATRLYESVGFRVTQQYVRYAREA
jgi:ribosomal protein S18 acetylase RimI-like enzyme